MEFPPDWDIRPQEDFELACTALATSGEPALVQLLAQLRPTGRILDNFRFSIGGSQILEAELDLGVMLPAEALHGYRLSFQYWPRDITIRRNMMSSTWQDVRNLVASNNATVLDPNGAGVLVQSSSRSWRSSRTRVRKAAPSGGPWWSARTTA
jgi:hypothetical protein